MKKEIISFVIILFVAFHIKSQNTLPLHQPITKAVMYNVQPSRIAAKLNASAVLNAHQDSSIKKRGCVTPILSEAYESWVQNVIEKQNQFSNTKKINTVYNIPVVFHIVHNGEAVGLGRNISQALINAQIVILNNDYRKTNSDFSTWVTQSSFVSVAADCEINFCAAKVNMSGSVMPEPGIDRINRNTKGWTSASFQGLAEPGGYIDNTVKNESYWDPTKYFNVWVLEMTDGVLGYAQFPDVPSGLNPVTDMAGQGGSDYSDGVVLDYRSIASNGASYTNYTTYNKGRTATHEIGHWLGLRHINGDSNCGDDYVSDTPTQSFLSSTCPSTSGAVAASGCAASPNPPGKMYQNYMDYSDDKCAVMFTTGQKARIQACMANCLNRASLNTSTVCSIPASIKEYESNLDISLYPNPANGEVFLEVNTLNENQDISIVVINTLGQTVKEVKQLLSNGGAYKLDLSDETKGVYFITVKSKSVSKTKRIILQ